MVSSFSKHTTPIPALVALSHHHTPISLCLFLWNGLPIISGLLKLRTLHKREYIYIYIYMYMYMCVLQNLSVRNGRTVQDTWLLTSNAWLQPGQSIPYQQGHCPSVWHPCIWSNCLTIGGSRAFVAMGGAPCHGADPACLTPSVKSSIVAISVGSRFSLSASEWHHQQWASQIWPSRSTMSHARCRSWATWFCYHSVPCARLTSSRISGGVLRCFLSSRYWGDLFCAFDMVYPALCAELPLREVVYKTPRHLTTYLADWSS